MNLVPMQLAAHHYRPVSRTLEETPEGVWFAMTGEQDRRIRCLVERSAWQARAMVEQPMADAVRENWNAITALASRKLLLAEPAPPLELHLTADDLFNIPWREREDK